MKTITKWTGSADQRYAASLAYDGTYIYAGMYNYAVGDKAEIVKFNSQLESQATWTGGDGGAQDLLHSENRIYAAFQDEITGYGAVGKFNTSLTELDRWVGDSDERGTFTIDANATHIYAGNGSSEAGKVIKINKSTMVKEDRLDGTNTEFIYGVKLVGSYLYVALRDSSTGKYLLWKVTPVGMTLSSTLDPGITGSTAGGSLDYDDTYLYWGIPTSPGIVLKISLSSFTENSRWTGATGENKVISVYRDSGSLYVSLNTSPGKVILVSAPSMASTDSWTGASGENSAWDTGLFGGRIYTALLTNPASVVKIGIARLFAWII